MKHNIGHRFVLSTILVSFCLCLFQDDRGAVVSSINPDISFTSSFNKHTVFATTTLVDINTNEYGSWTKADHGGYVEWSYSIEEEASSLNFGFSEMILPPSAVFSVYNQKDKLCQEYLPRANSAHHLELWTPILKGNTAKFKLRLLASEKALLRFRLTAINLGIPKNRNEPELCFIDVNCKDIFPKIEDFEAEIQSIGLITIEGTRICSGVLLNNVKEDLTPYFLTGRHCGINAENAASVVVHWNYENSSCRYETEENGVEGDGSLEKFNTGATYLSDLQRSDFTLLRLNDPVIDEANAYFAGWDATPDVPQNVTTIHHANTQEKRISFAEGVTSITRHFGQDIDLELDHIRVEEWSISSTASGSSGAPLFDDEHRVVGQLHGGLAACENDESDWFGRLHTSWLGDEVPERQLKHWLDPDDSGILVLDGKWNELTPLALQVSITQLGEVNCPGDETASISINIANGVGPFRYSIDGGESYQTQNQFQNLGAGFYSVLVKDASENISAIVPFKITEPDLMIFTHIQDYNQITLSIEGGEPPYLYSNNGVISFDSVFSEVPLGSITYKVIDSKGCSVELELDVNYNEFQAQLDIRNPITCSGNEDAKIGVVHSGTVGPYQYRLNNGPLSTVSVFENLAAGQYTASVIDSLGNIVVTEMITLEAPEPLIVELIQAEENRVVEVSGGVMPYEYQYDDGAFTDNNQFSATDNIDSVTVRDANGCEMVILNLFTSSVAIESTGEFNLYPNPASNHIIIETNGNAIISYLITNLNGQEVKREVLNQENNGNLRVNIHNMDAGIYFFRAITRRKNTKVLKFTVL